MSNVTTTNPLFDNVTTALSNSNDTLDLSNKIITFVEQTRPTVNSIIETTVQYISKSTPAVGAAVASSNQSGGANPAIYAPIGVVLFLVAVGSAFYGKKRMSNSSDERRGSYENENRNSRGLKVIPKSSKADFDESTAVYECMDSRSNMSLAQSMSFGGSKHNLNPHIDSISLHQTNSQMSLASNKSKRGGNKAPVKNLSKISAKIDEERTKESEKSQTSLQVINEIKPKKSVSEEKSRTNVNAGLSKEELKSLLMDNIESSGNVVQEVKGEEATPAAEDKQEEEPIAMPESQIEISVSPPQVVAAEVIKENEEAKPNADEEDTN